MRFNYETETSNTTIGQFAKRLAKLADEFFVDEHVPVVMGKLEKLYKNKAIVRLVDIYDERDEYIEHLKTIECRDHEYIFQLENEQSSLGWIICDMLS